MHVYGPVERFPMVPQRNHTPPEASLEAYRRMADAVGISRTVVVHPSIYGTDNRCSEQAVAALGAVGRGVAVLPAEVPDAELERLHGIGFRGVRFNMVNPGGLAETALEPLAARLAPLGWHVQVFTSAKRIGELADRLAALPTDVVVDHHGMPDARKPIDRSGFSALLDLLSTGRTWVKLSGAYRVDRREAPWGACRPFTEALLERRTDRLVWGTDWPHPDFFGTMPDDGELLDYLTDCVSDRETLQAILVDNPARLYDFT